MVEFAVAAVMRDDSLCLLYLMFRRTTEVHAFQDKQSGNFQSYFNYLGLRQCPTIYRR
jgi:hypothetical protein